MKRIFSAFLALAAAVAVVALPVMSKHNLTAVHGQSGCTVATVAGSYGFTFNGSDRVSSKTQAFVPFVGAGVLTFDGSGSVAAEFAFSYNGSIGSTTNYTGTYTVNSNCTGSIIATPGSGNSSVYFAVVGGGAELLATTLQTGNTWTLDAKRQ